MKRIVLLFITLLILPINVFAISANKAIVMDLNSGRVLYDLNKNQIYKECLKN